jgi:hypothetical protein
MNPAVVSEKDDRVRTSSRLLASCPEYEERETIYETCHGKLTSVHRNQFLTGATLKHLFTGPEDLPAAREIVTRPVKIDEAGTRANYERAAGGVHALPTLMVGEPIGSAVGLMGAETFALMLLDAPQIIEELVELYTEQTMKTLEAALKTGIRPLVWTGGSEWITPPYARPETFRALALPALKRIADIAHHFGCPVLAHCHGKISGVLEMFVEAGVDGIHPFEAPPSGDVTPEEFKRRAGANLCGVGNIQLDDMLRAPEAEIQRQVDRLLDVFSDWPEGGFVLSVTGTPTCFDAPSQAVKNYLCLLECKSEAK